VSSRSRLIAIAAAAAAVLVVIVVLLLRGGDDAAIARNSAAPQRDTVAGRAAAARNRPSGDDAFGAQFRGPGAVRVAGHVVDATTRAPVPGIDVVFSRGAAGEAIVTSAGDGAFTITVTPGEYEVRAVGEHAYATTRKLMVGRVADAMALEIEVSRLATLRGRVVDRSGAAVAGATVSVQPGAETRDAYEKDSVADQSTTSDGGGRFVISALPGLITLFAQSDAGQGVATVEGVASGTTRDAIVITLAPYGSVEGIVRAPDGRPCNGATVHLWLRIPGANTRQLDQRVTGVDGRFAFDRILNGPMTLDARATGAGLAAPYEHRMQPGEQLKGVVLDLQAPRSIIGRVVDTAGAPVPMVKVYLDRDKSRVAVGSTRSDADGRFRFDDLDGGPYIVSTRRAGYAPTKLTGVRAPADALELVVGDQPSLHGTVMAPDGRPVRDFTVTAGSHRPTRFASDDGRWELPALEPGKYDVTIEAAGYPAVHRSGVVVEPGASVPVDVTLAR